MTYDPSVFCIGDNVDTEALITWLKANRGGGDSSGGIGCWAGLDVFEQEPLAAASELWSLENVLLSPHAADMTDSYPAKSAQVLCDNLRRWRGSEQLRNVVDTARGY